MIIAKAPMRLSLSGGGSDLPGFLKHEGIGKTLTTTLNKYVYVSIHESSNSHFRMVYSEIEECLKPSEIRHSILRELLIRSEPKNPIELFSIADLPARGTGLGASSAFCLACVAALNRFNGNQITSVEAAAEASFVEMVLCGNSSGYQDQFASAIGGVSLNTFSKDGLVESTSLFSNTKETDEMISWLNKHLVFVRIEGSRESNDILSSIDFDNKSIRQIQREIADQTTAFMDALRSKELQKLGEFLTLNWKLKKSMSPLISNPKIEKMIEKGRVSGAYGSKLLGAGGSGYVVYFVDGISEFLDKMGAKDSGIRITGEKLQVMEI